MESDKINRVLRQLIPLADECNMSSKHTAMLLSGGKPVSSGFNHQRCCSSNQKVMSFHAEMHALSRFFNQNHEYGLKNFINDSDFTMLGRQNESYLLHNAKIIGTV